MGRQAAISTEVGQVSWPLRHDRKETLDAISGRSGFMIAYAKRSLPFLVCDRKRRILSSG